MEQRKVLYADKNKNQKNMSGSEKSSIMPVTASETAADKRKVILPRSKAYIYAMLTADEDKAENVKRVVKKMPLNNKLLGILSVCRIPGCIIHQIDKEGTILEHYESENAIPDALQEGYQVFLQHPGRFSVEVYTRYYCVVYEDGSVKFYERNVD